jgi:hypothetical protein
MAHTVTDVSPNLGAVADSVTITGTGFGAAQGASTVAFNGTAVVTYTSWSDTSIVVVVPVGTTSGLVVVTVSGAVQTAYTTSWFELEDTTIRSVEDIRAQDERADTSPEDWRYADANDINEIANLINNVLAPSVNDFRLTLTTALPVTTADVTGATTIYLTPHKGNRIALYTGRHWAVHSSAEVSLALGTLTSGLNYDVFAYSVAGVVTLEALAWTNDTTRATALVRQDGIWSKTGALTRRYVGTFRTTSTTATEDSAAKRFLFNAENRVDRRMLVKETTDSWTYSTDTYRSANNSTANRLQFVLGLSEEPVQAEVSIQASNSGGSRAGAVAIGLDSTTVESSDYHGGTSGETAGISSRIFGGIDVSIAVGFHFLQWMERAEAVGTTTWYGDAAVPARVQGAIYGRVMA